MIFGFSQGDVNYEGLRKVLETFGLKFTDVEYSRLLRVVDKEGRGKVRFVYHLSKESFLQLHTT